PLGFINPALYALPSSPTGSAPIDDILPAGKQGLTRPDFVNGIDASDGKTFSFRAIGYQGQEEYCDADGNCTTRNVALRAIPGYDNMTGLGSIGRGFVQALAGR